MSDENTAPTTLIYFSNTYLFELEDARVLAIGEAPEKQSSYVIVDKTIFYPQGGALLLQVFLRSFTRG
jgi:Ser-tRNA(Ala) deacylase AlaX